MIRHQLTRYWHDDTARSDDDPRAHERQETAQAHPPVPSAALERVRAHCVDRRGGPIRWWHRDAAPWGAVRDLYCSGRPRAADELARLLAWCETRFEHDHARFWEITECPAQQALDVPLFDTEGATAL